MARRGRKKRTPDKLPSKKELVSLFGADDAAPMRLKEVLRLTNLGPGAKTQMRATLKELVDEGSLVRLSGGRYTVPGKTRKDEGILRVNPVGFGFVIRDEGPPDIYVAANRMGSALHGDRVEIVIERKRRPGSVEGRVTRVLERANKQIIGVYNRKADGGVVEPADDRIHTVVRVGSHPQVKPGDLVVADVDWEAGRGRMGAGKIVEVIGPADDPGSEVIAIARKLEIPTEFSEAVLAESAGIVEDISAEQYSAREDLRDRIIVTIDGADARDFDDAVGITRRGRNWVLTVSIADVSAYVRPGSALDAEALDRGNSVYFPNRVIPMLPEKLSNGVCSLNPEVDRLTMTAEMVFTDKGKRVDSRFYNSVIRSAKRCTYAEVAEILDGKKVQGYSDEVGQALQQMNKLAKAITAKRLGRGALDLDMPEAWIELDEKGFPKSIKRRSRLDSHRMIEEFMIAANEAVAEQLQAAGLGNLYRIHEQPPAEAVETLSAFLKFYGLSLPEEEPPSPADLAQVLEKVKGKPYERAVSEMVLRSLAKARYSPRNHGHFGLASKAYSHFTSPIRRYPDLVTHRVLKHYLSADYSDQAKPPISEGKLQTIAEHTSMTERRSEDAEREADNFFAALYMRDKIEQQFFGTISGVTEFGFFVELNELFVEGLVKVADIAGWYRYDPDRRILCNDASGRRFCVGDTVLVEVVEVSLSARRVLFDLVEGPLKPNRIKKLRDEGFT